MSEEYDRMWPILMGILVEIDEIEANTEWRLERSDRDGEFFWSTLTDEKVDE